MKLLPVRVAEAEASAAARVAALGPAGRMEIVLGGGERIIVGVDVDATAVARVVRAVARDDSDPGGVRVWLATGHTDMRRGSRNWR